MGKKRPKFAVAALLLFLLVACDLQSTPISKTPTTTTMTLRATEVTVPPTLTETSAALTLDPVAQKLKDIVFSPCLTVSPEPPGGDQIPWVLLAIPGIIPYAIDPNTGEMTDQLLPDSNPFGPDPFAADFAVSPDGKWLAYDLYGEDDVSLVVEPSGNILTNSSQGRIIWQPSQPSRLEGWLSNENVILVKNHSWENFGSTLIYNPLTGEQYEFFLEEMPDAQKQVFGRLSGSYLMDHGNLIPDPTLQRIVYPSGSGPTEGLQMVLWDVENKRALTSLRYTEYQLFRDPFWSQDGSDFLVIGVSEAGLMEWFQVTKEGAIHQLTYFGNFLKDAEFNYPSRSWNGRYLVFQLLYNDRKDEKYLILDSNSPTLDGFCLDLGREYSGSWNSPSWSPDSRYVAVTYGSYLNDTSDVILVDVEKRETFTIGKDIDMKIEATGWIVKP